MKKILCLTLALIMIVGSMLSFSACSDSNLQFGSEYRELNAQIDVLLQLKAGSIDVGVMDSIMAGYYMKQDSAYSGSLMIVENLTLATEQYGIAARKGSGFVKKINEALIALANDGTVNALAEKYGIASELCIDKNATVAPLTESEMVDWNNIVNEGTFIVGYTLFAPIAYTDTTSGELIGFDIELARAVAAKLNLNVEFKEIEWAAKESLLNGGNIDCIWNGMTINEERLAAMEITIPYLNNKQVAVIRIEDKDKYTSKESMSDAIIGAEGGSAGESCVVKAEEE